MSLNGAIVGQYHIIKQIGKGGMATVYKAYQPNLDRYVAIKVLTTDLSDTTDFVARFEREARAVAKLRHRNILTIFDYGRQAEVFYLVMEYVGGGTLMERLGWPQDLAYAVSIVSQVGDALAHAHRQGLIHRDVKPGNILMAGEDWPLLSDFGLAKMLEDSLHLTASGASVGTPQYMSPEQAEGLKVDQRSDIYSLGIVLYEALTGRPPFGTDSPAAMVLRRMNEPPVPPRALRSDLPQEMERIILKALAKSPADRYPRMEEFLADLQTAFPLPANGAINGLPGPTGQPAAFVATPVPVETPRLPRRRSFSRARFAIGTVLLLILALALLSFKDSLAPLVSALAGVTATVPNPSPMPSPSATLRPSPTLSPSTATPPPTAKPTLSPRQTITVQVWQADGVEMVFVPAGEFLMGSAELGDDERPARRVYLDDFWIDRYEVTNDRFDRFVAATGYQTEAERRGWGWVWKVAGWDKVEGADWRHPRGPDSGIEGKLDHPVVLVSWNDAAAYCLWAEKRLPSEAQWEKAARGTLTDSGYGLRYAWGDEFDRAQANTNESGLGDTTPVGSFSPGGDSPYGACDMTGNVWEWVADWYSSDYYSQAPPANPPGPASGVDKVLRGGSWPFDEVYARTAFRYNVKPDYTYDFAGFRCSNP